MTTLAPEWIRPSTILFASECPADEKVSTVALAQAKESGSNLVILNVCDETAVPGSCSGTAEEPLQRSRTLLEPIIQHARDLGIQCEVELRKGIVTEEILKFLNERKFDRVVMGVHTPGPIGKLLVGSVAETLLRRANIPVATVGPYPKSGTYRDFLTRTILCGVSSHRSSETVAHFAAELALRHRARLVLQYVVAPQDSGEALAGRRLDKVEQELLDLIPDKVRTKLRPRAVVVLGDPTEELLYLGRVLHANLIVIGAHDATHFAAVSNSGMVYKVLAYAPCPVLTLSPVVLAGYGPGSETLRSTQMSYLPGVV